MDFKERTKLKIAISKIEEENGINKKNTFAFKKSIGIAACFAIILSGIVYAKDIENYFKKIFNNSTEAIDKAVENGYVQQEDMDYTYDKDIGIKVDSLVLDDLNLDIAFNFETKKENIKSIQLKNFIITNENGKKVYESELKYAYSLEDVYLANSVKWNDRCEKITDTIFTDSILFGLRKTENELNELNFEISSLNITYYDGTLEELRGNWNFTVEIKDKMKKNNNISYHLYENNEYVESCTGTLSATGISINLKLAEPFYAMQYVQENIGKINDIAFFYLEYNNEKVAPSQIELGDISNTSYNFRYDNIGIFSDNISELKLYLEPFDTTITLIEK